MLNSQPKQICQPDPSKNEHRPHNLVQKVPQGALLLSMLKTLESQFQRKGFLRKSSRDSFYPLWFLAETERNVFLWRGGYSLNRQHEFEFWVDIDALISKRLDQLESAASNAQHITSGWGIAVLDRDLAIRERDYLITLAGLIGKIQAHASALSHVGLILEKEIAPSGIKRARVVLPS
jgi:hypothetical protein